MRIAPRRRFLFEAGLGFFGSAIGYLLAQEQGDGAKLPGVPQARAKSVIMLLMCGGVSHIDTFDPKDNKFAGKMIDAVGFGDNLAKMLRPVIHCSRTFKRYGESGTPVSDWFPHVGGVVDDLAIVRSMYCQETNHSPAVIEMATGHRDRLVDHPALGAWVSYSLGSANQNLPVFVNMGRASSPVQLNGGYLGATHAATPFRTGDTPIDNLYPPASVSHAERDQQMKALENLNREFRQRHAIEEDIAARLKSYELAARMQLEAPGVVDLSKEPKSVLDLYGMGAEPTDSFGRQLLLARRLAEKGVRFIQVCHGGGGNGAWDAHSDIASHEPLCRQTDKPIAGLITDLKARGMLDSTLVVWASEFGRTPWSQNTKGRDHNPRGFTVWLAGGGVRGGIIHGSTDEVGYKAVDKPHYISDLQSTILHQMGIDHKKMMISVNSRPVRLVEEGFGPMTDILS
jgi:Protein of unknown function (DUF1501)